MLYERWIMKVATRQSEWYMVEREREFIYSCRTEESGNGTLSVLMQIGYPRKRCKCESVPTTHATRAIHSLLDA